MTPDELQEAIAVGREQRGVEFKGPGRRDDADFMARVTRAILGMANKEDGGEVVIGVEDKQQALTLVGLSVAEQATWNYDDVQSVLSNYADPFVDIDVAIVTVGNLTPVVITVRPFAESPVLCKKDYSHSKTSKRILQAGALYIRSRGGSCQAERDSRHLKLLSKDRRRRAALVDGVERQAAVDGSAGLRA